MLESERTEALRVRESERESTCKGADGDGDVSGAVCTYKPHMSGIRERILPVNDEGIGH